MGTEQTRLEWVVTGQEQVKQMAAVLVRLTTAQKQLNTIMSRQGSQAVNVQKTAAATARTATNTRVLVTLMKQQLILSKQIANNARSMGVQTSNLNKQTNTLLISWRSIGKIIVGSLISRGIGRLLREFRQAADEAMQFEIRISEIRTIAQDNQRSFGAWARSVRELSDAFGSPLLDIAEANYQTLSNQIAKGVEATRFMVEAQRFALITVSSTTEAVNLLSGSLNAYGESAENARKHGNTFFKMIELGRVRASDIHSSFGQVQIVAAQLGITTEELAAAMATLTKQGINPSMAMTGLRNVIQKLIRPTDHMRETFDRWGVTSGAAAVETHTFIGVFRKLIEEAKDSGDVLDYMGESFGRIRAILGAVGLSHAFDEFEENFEKIKNAAESADEAFEIMQESAGFELKREIQRLANVFIVDIGRDAIAAVVGLNDAVGGFAKRLEDLISIAKHASLILGFYFLAPLVVKLYTTAAAMHLVAIAQGAITIEMYALSVASQTATYAVGRLGIAMKALLANPAIIFAVIAYATYRISDYFMNVGGEMNALSEGMTQKFEQESQRRVEIVRKETAIMIEEYTKAVQRQADEVDYLLTKLEQLYNANRAKGNLQLKLQKELLAAQEKTKNAAGKADLWVAQYIKYRKLAAQASDSGNLEIASDYLTEMARMSRKLGEIDGKRFAQARYSNIREIRGLRVRVGSEITILRTKEQQAKMNRELVLLRRDLVSQTGDDFTAWAGVDMDEEFKNLNNLAKAHGRLTIAITAEAEAADQSKRDALKAQQALQMMAQQMKENLGGFSGVRDLVGKAISAEERQLVINWSNQLNNTLSTLNESKNKLLDTEKSRAMKLDLMDMAEKFKYFKEEGIRPTRIWWWSEDTGEKLQSMISAATAMSAFQEDAKESVAKADQLRENMPDFMNTVNGVWEGYSKVTSGLIEFADAGQAQLNFLTGSMVTLRLELTRLDTQISVLIKRANASIAVANKAAAIGTDLPRWKGGYMARFATGGSVASDNISALLRPGEFVMNKNAARQFFPQLVAMNSGAARFDSGGDVVNNNVGDINVSVQGGDTSEVTVRRIAAGLRREIHRGTVRLN